MEGSGSNPLAPGSAKTPPRSSPTRGEMMLQSSGSGSPAGNDAEPSAVDWLAQSPNSGSPMVNDAVLGTISMAGRLSEPSAFDLLVQGVEQSIHIPLKTMLIAVMRKMPARMVPVFKCAKYSSDRFQASVELNVSGSRVTVEPGVSVATIVGEIAATPHLSQQSAVKKAFEYLEKKHFVHVSDYSSEVVEDYEHKSVWGDVNSVAYTLEKVLGEWSELLSKIDNFQLQLERNVNLEKTHGVRSRAGDVYAESENFFAELLTRYRDKQQANESAYKEYEARRSKFLRESNDKVTRFSIKAYRQFISFTKRDVLSCVLREIGLSGAEYTNEPSDGGQFKADVVLQLPDIEDARCGGRTRFHGYLRLSAGEAEEDAAYKALRFMESRLKVTIVDMNYLDKVEAGAVHQSMMHLLRNMVRLADNIARDCTKMTEYMDAGADMFDGPIMRTVTGPELAAVKFCEEGMGKIRAEIDTAYKAAVAKLKQVEKYYPAIVDYDD